MAEDVIDPRDVAWHPRRCPKVQGHDKAFATLTSAFASGKMPHAWMLSGEEGIGKASLAYAFARHVLSDGRNNETTNRWIEAKSHPNLFVLERKMTDRKPHNLKTEISVDDARDMVRFFEQTSALGGWRVAIVDCADDLNTESANALLKLVEEPPSKSLILLVVNRPGRLLRTLRSRCQRLPMSRLAEDLTLKIINKLPLDSEVSPETRILAASMSGGSPGQALRLFKSEGAIAFHALMAEKSFSSSSRLKVVKGFSQRGPGADDMQVFGNLLLDWIANQARSSASPRGSLKLSDAFAEVARVLRETAAFNLDRKQTVIDLMQTVEQALKAA
jgi:DNA polymerase-3 subunit delta'